MRQFRYFFVSIFLAIVLAGCGQTPSQRLSDVPPAQDTDAKYVLGVKTSAELAVKVIGYTDSQGNSISESKALELQKQSTRDNIPPGLACSASTSVRAYPFSPNAYGRVQLDCFEVGGRFDSIGYATVRITDPNGRYADGYQTSGTGSQHAEVLGGPVGKINGRYVIQGTLQASYSKPTSQFTRTVYQLETRPLTAQYATW
jgi:hypothetical protein